MSVRFHPEFRTLAIPRVRQHKVNSAMTDTSPTTVNRTLPRRLPNSAYRVREYLTEKEVDRLIEAAKRRGRKGARDAAAILLAYGHGLRASELCSLRWSQIDLRNGRLHVNRVKGGQESVRPLHGPELRALRPLQGNSPYVFVTAAGTPVTPAWWRKKYGALMPSEMKRLRQLEEENGKLKKIVADLSLDKEMLQDVIRRKL